MRNGDQLLRGRKADTGADTGLAGARAQHEFGHLALRVFFVEDGNRPNMIGRSHRAVDSHGQGHDIAVVHQFGGVIRAKAGGKLAFRMGGKLVRTDSVTIPARPYLGISTEDGAMILEVVEGALDRALGSGASSVTRPR